MNKVITTAAAILCLAGAANAGDARTSHSKSSNLSSTQHTVLVGVDLDAALPLGTYGDANGIGAGALLNVEYPVIDQLSLTGRVGFQYHTDKSPIAGIDMHVHSIPVLLGAKYYVMQNDRQGVFAAAELGMFGLMASASSGGASASETQMKLGVGLGAGYQWNQWTARINVHSHDVGNFGDFFMVTGGVGYQFAGF